MKKIRMRFRYLAIIVSLLALLSAGLALPPDGNDAQAQVRSSSVGTAVDSAQVSSGEAISLGIAYLKTKQLDDGGIEGFTPGVADEFTTIKTVIALAASRLPNGHLTQNGNSTLDYLATRAVAYTHQTGTTLLFPGRAGMVAVAVVAADGDPTSFGTPNPMDIVAELAATYHDTTGEYSTTAVEGWSSGAASTMNQVWAILGLAAAGQPIPEKAAIFLVGLQEADGGWGYGAGGDVDTTALVIQALIASGHVSPDHTKIQEGLAFLRSNQAATGGWESWGSLSADSTAAAIQGIVAAGYTPATRSWAASSGRTPHDELLALQDADGSFGGNALGTAHAIAGLAESPLPIAGSRLQAQRALSWMVEQQKPDGSWDSPFDKVGATCDAALAFAAAGFDPDSVVASGSSVSALDYLAANASEFAVGTAERSGSPDKAGKLALVVVAAGADPTNFGGVDLVQTIESYYAANAYGDAGNTWHQSLAILGLAAAGQSVPDGAVATLKGLQQADGGWKYDLSPSPWNTTTPDSTGLAMQALIAAGVPANDASIVSALSFLSGQQDTDGGWSDANSTAFAMQGLLAAGEDLRANWLKNGHSPYEALSSYAKSDGPFVWAWSFPADNLMATSQSVPALLGASFPIVSAQPLSPFSAVSRGADPDRLVTSAPRASLDGSGIAVVVPFGSDLNQDGAVALSWRRGSGSWQSLTTVRADGHFTAVLNSQQSGRYEFRAVFSDPDGLQGATVQTGFLDVPQWVVTLPLVYGRAGR